MFVLLGAQAMFELLLPQAHLMLMALLLFAHVRSVLLLEPVCVLFVLRYHGARSFVQRSATLVGFREHLETQALRRLLTKPKCFATLLQMLLLLRRSSLKS